MQNEFHATVVDTSCISAILCVRNSQDLIPRTVSALISEGILPNHIIVVDGESTDTSVKIARSLGCTVVSDHGAGFVFARSLGISLVRTDFTLILGPDDEMQPGSVLQLYSELISDRQLAAVQASKRADPNLRGFFSKGMDYYYQRSKIGVVPVVGNPSLYRMKLLVDVKYDREFSANEDTDWCSRVKEFGYKVKRSADAVSIEFEPFNWGSFSARWRWYGKGDYAFIRKYSSKGEIIKVVRHFFHPFLEYIVRLSLPALLKGKIRESLFLFLCAVLRYLGLLIAGTQSILQKRQVLKGR